VNTPETMFPNSRGSYDIRTWHRPFLALALGEIKVNVFMGLPGEYQVVSINIGAAETRGCMNVAGRGNKKSKKYVFD
jgi:hypothetical protein